MFDKYFTVAFEALTLNKVRSALTMLGMIIGVLSVIVLVGLGQASQAYVTAQVQGLGSGLMIVMPGSPEASGGLGMAGGLARPSLTLTDARAIESLPGVTFSSPASVLMTVVQVGENTVGAEVVGTTPEIQQLITLAMGEGRFFTDQENRSGARVAVIGHEVASELFKNTLIAPLGAKIEVGEQRFRVIGVLAKSKGAVESTDRQVLMPTRTFRNSLRQTDYVDVIYVKAAAEDLLPAVEARMTALLRQRHGIRLDEEDDFNIQTQAELLAIVTTVTQTFTVLLAGIAAISLLVGGIGIMNIMLVSVTERTREIGVRKAVGAKRRDVLAQFLIESATISLAGGAVGIALGLGLTFAITRVAALPFVVSPAAVIGGFLFSAAVGIFFGLYPADKASKLDPVDALRYE